MAKAAVITDLTTLGMAKLQFTPGSDSLHYATDFTVMKPLLTAK